MDQAVNAQVTADEFNDAYSAFIPPCKYITKNLQDFIDHLSKYIPEADVSMNALHQFTNPTTRAYYAMYQLGRSSHVHQMPGAFVVAELTEKGFVFDNPPSLISHPLQAMKTAKHRRDVNGGEHFLFSLTRGAHDAVQRLTGKSSGEVRLKTKRKEASNHDGSSYRTGT